MRSTVQKVAGLIQKVEEQEGREQVVLLAAAPHARTLLLPHPKMVTEQPGSILTGSHSAFSPLASSVQHRVCEICAHCVLWLIRPLLLSVP